MIYGNLSQLKRAIIGACKSSGDLECAYELLGGRRQIIERPLPQPTLPIPQVSLPEPPLSLPVTYPNTVGLWYQVNPQIDVSSIFCTTSTGTPSDTITWTSSVAASNTYTSGVIPPPNEGLPTPLNLVLFFFNNVSLADNLSALNITTNPLIINESPYLDATTSIINYSKYCASTVTLGITLGGGNNTIGMWTMDAVYNNIIWIQDSNNVNTLLSNGINTICLDVEVGGWTTSSGDYVPFSAGEALPWSTYPESLISAITASYGYQWSYGGQNFNGGLIHYLSTAGFAVYTTISHSAPYGWYWSPGASIGPDYGNYSGPIVEALLQCPYINQYNFQLYTQSVGTMNEYAYTNGISWTDVAQYIQGNPNWTALQNAGQNPGQMISASVYIYDGFNYSGTSYPGLFYGAGTNVNNPPLMSYNTTGSGCDCASTDPFPEPTPSDFPLDTGANAFLCDVFGVKGLAGCVQYCNGNFIERLSPASS